MFQTAAEGACSLSPHALLGCWRRQALPGKTSSLCSVCVTRSLDWEPGKKHFEQHPFIFTGLPVKSLLPLRHLPVVFEEHYKSDVLPCSLSFVHLLQLIHNFDKVEDTWSSPVLFSLLTGQGIPGRCTCNQFKPWKKFLLLYFLLIFFWPGRL